MKNKTLIMTMAILLIGSHLWEENEVKRQQPADKIIFENFNYKTLTTDHADDADERIFLTVKFDYETNFKMSMSEENDLKAIQEQRKEKLNIAKEYYTLKNNLIVESLDLSSFNEIYVSHYSPYMSISTDWENISSSNFVELHFLAESQYVEAIYVNKALDFEENLYQAKNFVNVNEYINNPDLDLTGEGVVVGILEPSILDKNHINLVNTNVEVRNEWYYIETKKDHTTIMGSAIAGTKGIAPKAKLLSVELSGDPVSEIDWMLDRNVNVINMSFGEKNPSGNYSSQSAYMDFIVETYKITIVASAGNEGENTGHVSNPGLGYNIITVGACSSSKGTARAFSSTVVNNGPRKPNIMAPGYALVVPNFSGSQSGTSISAAITTGCIALLMQRDPIIIYHPERAMAMLSSTANRPNSLYFNKGLDEKTGAGSLDFKNIKTQYTNNYGFFLEQNQTTINIVKLLSAQKDQTIRVAVSWLAKANGTASNTTKSNYDIYLCDANGNIISSQETSRDCVELIEYKALSNGEYGLKIIQKGTRTYDENLSVSFFVK